MFSQDCMFYLRVYFQFINSFLCSFYSILTSHSPKLAEGYLNMLINFKMIQNFKQKSSFQWITLKYNFFLIHEDNGNVCFTCIELTLVFG